MRLSSSASPSFVTSRFAGSSRTSPISIGFSSGWMGRLRSPEYGPDACHHLAGAERLHDVVVGAELEPDDPVGLFSARGEHDDRNP